MAEELSVNFISNLNATVLISLTILYMWRRYLISDKPKINPLSGRLRLVGTWMLQASVMSLLIFLGSLTFLSMEDSPKRATVELLRSFSGGGYRIAIYGRTIDLSDIMLYAMNISEILLISAVFIAISLEGKASREEKETSSFRCSIRIFSKIWAALRLLVLPYAIYRMREIPREIYIFLIEIALVAEYTMACICLLIVAVQQPCSMLKDDTNPLLWSMMGYGIVKHAINLINFPFTLQNIHIEVLMSLGLGIQAVLYITLCNVLCPLPKQKETVDNSVQYAPLSSYPSQEVYEIPFVHPFADGQKKVSLVHRIQ